MIHSDRSAFNSPSARGAFDDGKLVAWQKGCIISGHDPDEWRMNRYGSLMRFAEYGKKTVFGWSTDQSYPDSSAELPSLEALYWPNHRKRNLVPAEDLDDRIR